MLCCAAFMRLECLRQSGLGPLLLSAQSKESKEIFPFAGGTKRKLNGEETKAKSGDFHQPHSQRILFDSLQPLDHFFLPEWRKMITEWKSGK